MLNWVSHHGVPQIILLDIGKEFKKDSFQEAYEQLRIKQKY